MGPDIPLLADGELIAAVKTLAEHERHATARLVTALAEMERRRLYRGQGCSTLYEYCVKVLQLSEDAAYTRAHVARVGVQYPAALEELASGAVSMTALRLLEPVLTRENHRELLAAIRHRSKRDVERFIAKISPTSEIDPPILPRSTFATSSVASRPGRARAVENGRRTISRRVRRGLAPR